jgi:DNA (cytosine-5)-methyltransferase 1
MRTCISLFSGGGLLDQAATQAGYIPVYGVEVRRDYADCWRRNHKAPIYVGCVSKAPLRSFPHTDLMLAGIPCEPYSRIRNKSKLPPEQHELADLACWVLLAVYQCRPDNLIVEEVPGFLEHPTGVVFQSTLRRMGYCVESSVLRGTDHGSLFVRDRAVIVARLASGSFPWPVKKPLTHTLGKYLLPADHPECRWFTRKEKPWVFDHEVYELSRGNKYRTVILTEDSQQIPGLTRRYFNGVGGQPVVGHPDKLHTYRWFTVGEVKRLMGLPEDYWLPEQPTIAGQILNQGVLVNVFEKVIRQLDYSLRRVAT